MSSEPGRCLGEIDQFNSIRDPAVFELFPDFTQNAIRQIARRQNRHVDIGSPAGLASAHGAEKVYPGGVPLQPLEKNAAHRL
jgi:hypothetical protein